MQILQIIWEIDKSINLQNMIKALISLSLPLSSVRLFLYDTKMTTDPTSMGVSRITFILLVFSRIVLLLWWM